MQLPPDVLQFLLDSVPEPQLLAMITKTNESGSTAVHWAVSNNQVDCAKKIVEHPAIKPKAVDLLAVRHNHLCLADVVLTNRALADQERGGSRRL